MMKANIVKLLGLLLLGAPVANAFVTLTIEPTSPTEAMISGVGTLEGETVPPNWDFLVLQDPFGVRPTYWSNESVRYGSSMRVGTLWINYAHDAGAGFSLVYSAPVAPAVYFSNGTYTAFAPGAAVQGTVGVTLKNGTTWAAPGTAGNVWWGTYAGSHLVGSWRIAGEAAVPEPGTLALLGLGLAGLGLTRRKAA